MVQALVTGGAGFIGRAVVQRLLQEHGMEVTVFDNYANSSPENVREFKNNPRFHGVIEGDMVSESDCDRAFSKKFDIVFHLAAQINVQESIDFPERSFQSNLVGTYHILERCRKQNACLVLVSTCMVYDQSMQGDGISETHAVKPRSPYAGSKLAAENLVESYYHAFQLPVVILRPFNTYGPFQKTNMEGGVVSIFLNRILRGEKLSIYGDGNQTRDLLYVEEAADFIVQAGFHPAALGQVLNAGLGKEVSINDLALLIAKDPDRIEHIPHHHPQAEIAKLLCDNRKAKRLIGWTPKHSLEQGIQKTLDWIRKKN